MSSFIGTIMSKNFPRLLNIDDYPSEIYYKGNPNLLNSDRIIAVIGTRKPSAYGIRVTHEFVEELVKNDFVIVSGLAYGIDSEAHKICLKYGGKAIVVLAQGLETSIYPSKNTSLLNEIVSKGGLVLSEYSPQKTPKPYMFLERSRIISGISKALLIIEAAKKGGSVSAAYQAFNQNVPVFAVPGGIYSVSSKGTNDLIARQIAQTVVKTYDVLRELDIVIQDKIEEKPKLSADESAIFALLQQDEYTVDSLSDASGMVISRVIAALYSLESKNLIYRGQNLKYFLKHTD
jgi:DNA processing protein